MPHGALAFGYATTILYNIYGKRCPVPMITDAVQGLAWGSLALFGALLVGEPSPMTLIPVAFGFGFIFLINGVHGGLRDFDNDLNQGRITTSIYLGATSRGDGTVLPSTALRVFSVIAFLIILFPGALAFTAGWLPYHGAVFNITFASWIIVNLCSAWLLYQVLRTHQAHRLRAIYQHQLPLLSPPVFIMLPILDWSLQAALLACFFLPMILFVPRVRSLARWLKNAEAYPENPLDYLTVDDRR